MSTKSSKAFFFAIFISLLFNTGQCHELLIDFLEFQNLQVNLGQDCEKDLNILRQGIENNEVWALKVRDASGSSTPGFNWGNNFWLGGERNCHLLNDPPKINLIKSEHRHMQENFTDIGSKIKVEYRIFYASHTSLYQFDADLFNKSILHVGLCFPASCSDDDSDSMAKILFENKFQHDIFLTNVKYVGTKILAMRKNLLGDPFVILLM